MVLPAMSEAPTKCRRSTSRTRIDGRSAAVVSKAKACEPASASSADRRPGRAESIWRVCGVSLGLLDPALGYGQPEEGVSTSSSPSLLRPRVASSAR